MTRVLLVLASVAMLLLGAAFVGADFLAFDFLTTARCSATESLCQLPTADSRAKAWILVAISVPGLAAALAVTGSCLFGALTAGRNGANVAAIGLLTFFVVAFLWFLGLLFLPGPIPTGPAGDVF